MVCAAGKGIQLVANVGSVSDVYESAQVMVNPVLVGSGVNMKALELLDCGKPVISTPQGVKGLPEEHQRLFIVEKDPARFAQAILSELNFPSVTSSRLPACYRPEAAQALVEQMSEVVNATHQNNVPRLGHKVAGVRP